MDQTSDTTDKNGHNGSPSRWKVIGVIAALAILASPFVYIIRSAYQPEVLPLLEPLFVGSQKCGSCHKGAFEKWQGSHHDLAMDIANEATVLGDFDNVLYTDPYNNQTSRFFKKDDGFYVETEGPDGMPGIFKISYTFGAYPLQQYLIPFPGGRLQCLNIAWDVNKGEWYRLPPYEVDGPNDWLHWTKGGQTWNGMCAECHSTRLIKGFSIESESYETRWFEIDVGCEACHGPGSAHVTWADKPEMARPQLEYYGLLVKTNTLDNQKQISICAPCHSRRFQLADNTHEEGELLDKMVPVVLQEGLYYPDGQILEEVYVFGSYTQSKMYQRGVRCSDCHDIHSLNLHRQDNEICLQCHRAEDYDSPTHHFHKREVEGKPSNGHLCVKCHMPGRHYMGIDYRPDHSIRIPRPDLSKKLGVPNSCHTAECHPDRSLEWIQENYTKWYGTSRKPHYGEVIAAGRNRSPDAGIDLIRLAEDPLLPVIVRATALTLLTAYPAAEVTPVFEKALQEENALLRYTAIRNLNPMEQEHRIKLLEPKLYDHVKAVRIEAAIALASVPLSALGEDHRLAFTEALEEYRQAMLYNSDFAPQRYNLGNLEATLGNQEKAIAYYEQALIIDDLFYPAKINLATLLNQRGDNDRAVTLLKEVINTNPDLNEVSYSLGLLLAEMGQFDEALPYLGKAADGMPLYSRARYNYALALLKLKKWPEGEQSLLQALELEPDNREFFVALANLYLNFRMTEKAKRLAQKTLDHFPDHEQARQVLESLK